MADTMDTALKKVDLNASDAVAVAAAASETTNDPTACSFCKKSKATKRCSKRHAKCLKKIFCDSICETQAHKKKIEGTPKEDTPISGKEDEAGCDKKDAKAEAEKAAKAKKKKARKAANAGKKGNDGSFWWNNAVYASW